MHSQATFDSLRLSDISFDSSRLIRAKIKNYPAPPSRRSSWSRQFQFLLLVITLFIPTGHSHVASLFSTPDGAALPFNIKSGRSSGPALCLTQHNDVGVCVFLKTCLEMKGRLQGTCTKSFFFASCCILPNATSVNTTNNKDLFSSLQQHDTSFLTNFLSPPLDLLSSIKKHSTIKPKNPTTTKHTTDATVTTSSPTRPVTRSISSVSSSLNTTPKLTSTDTSTAPKPTSSPTSTATSPATSVTTTTLLSSATTNISAENSSTITGSSSWPFIPLNLTEAFLSGNVTDGDGDSALPAGYIMLQQVPLGDLLPKSITQIRTTATETSTVTVTTTLSPATTITLVSLIFSTATTPETSSTSLATAPTTVTTTSAPVTSSSLTTTTTLSTTQSTVASSPVNSTTGQSSTRLVTLLPDSVSSWTDNASLPTVPYITSTASTSLSSLATSTTSATEEGVDTATSSGSTATVGLVAPDSDGQTPVTLSDICGITPLLWQRDSGRDARIVGGTEAKFGEFPWQVSLRRIVGQISSHRCGAALVHPRWVITAAHCASDIPTNRMVVRIGEYDFRDANSSYPHVDIRIAERVIHQKFNFLTFENDIALLRLAEPVKLAPHIIPICLAPYKNYTGSYGTISGWGRLSQGGALPPILHKVEVPFIGKKVCESWFDDGDRHQDVEPVFICAGYKNGGQDACQGDSGGPVVQKVDGRWGLVGVISWGIGCAEPNLPGVSTLIPLFADWIKTNSEGDVYMPDFYLRKYGTPPSISSLSKTSRITQL